MLEMYACNSVRDKDLILSLIFFKIQVVIHISFYEVKKNCMANLLRCTRAGIDTMPPPTHTHTHVHKQTSLEMPILYIFYSY